ncbi:C2 calcium-dependent membrane targeting [Macleaya cordata]|uniref:C2 calcium-dependent membrane targeting n=1 Tax=Macleaya cordata TaxID=56857 RepID=A0A200Q661_MACCD|nr:C2 calcium-dependent membrane targeting [Macleaya cordata]
MLVASQTLNVSWVLLGGFAGKMDPYVLIRYKNHERKSSVARGAGSNPVWNEKFNFRVQYPGADDDDQYKLILRIMDEDTFSADDFIGEAVIYVTDVISLGAEKGTAELRPTKYRVVLPNKSYHGEIRVGVTFTKKVEDEKDKDLGGWKESLVSE